MQELEATEFYALAQTNPVKCTSKNGKMCKRVGSGGKGWERRCDGADHLQRITLCAVARPIAHASAQKRRARGCWDSNIIITDDHHHHHHHQTNPRNPV